MSNSYLEISRVHRLNPPSSSEIRALLSGSRNSRANSTYYDVILIVATTGIKPGEFRQLKWLSIHDDRYFLVSFKFGRERIVPFGPIVLKRLIERQEYQSSE